MNKKITVNPVGATPLEVELVIAFAFEENEYVIYTQNEIKDNNLVLSIAKLTREADKIIAQKIEDTNEWNNVKNIMKEIIATGKSNIKIIEANNIVLPPSVNGIAIKPDSKVIMQNYAEQNQSTEISPSIVESPLVTPEVVPEVISPNKEVIEPSLVIPSTTTAELNGQTIQPITPATPVIPEVIISNNGTEEVLNRMEEALNILLNMIKQEKDKLNK